MEQEATKKKTKSGVLGYLMYLGIYLVVMGIIWLFIYPSFRHWMMESELQPIQVSYVRDGGSETQWIGDGYDYYVNVGYRGQNYRINVSEGVYTGSDTATLYYDASKDQVFEAGTGHTKVVIYFLTLACTFIGLFVYMPIHDALKKKKTE